MAVPAPCLIRLPAADHDDRTVPECRLAIDEPLIPGRRAPTHHADRLELVHHLGDAHEGGHRTERQASKIDVGARENDAHPAVGEPVRQIDDGIIDLNCASSTATTSVVSRRRREISSAESTGSASTVTPSCDDTEKRPAYREIGRAHV